MEDSDGAGMRPSDSTEFGTFRAGLSGLYQVCVDKMRMQAGEPDERECLMID